MKVSGLVIILGSPNDSEGNLSPMAVGRIETGLRVWKENRLRGFRILLTGGISDHFNPTDKPHAEYTQKALMQLGVPESEFVEFAESRHTVEDARLSLPIVEKYQADKLIIVTSDFHMDRAQFIFKTIFAGWDLEFVSAPYLKGISDEERDRLVSHETRALASLKANGIH